jgi:hypothetical protein
VREVLPRHDKVVLREALLCWGQPLQQLLIRQHIRSHALELPRWGAGFSTRGWSVSSGVCMLDVVACVGACSEWSAPPCVCVVRMHAVQK